MKFVIGVLLMCWVTAYAKTPSVGQITGGQEIVFPGWLKDSFLEIADDAKDAAEEGKHVILFFHLDGCPYCTVMMKESFAEAPFVDDLRQNFSVIQINIKGDRDVAFDENTSLTEKELAEQLKVFSTPTILFLDVKGKPVLRFNGYRTQGDFKHALDFVKDKKYQEMSFVSYLHKAPKDKVYTLLPHEALIATTDLSSLPKETPVAVIFEDHSCALCADFHQRILGNSEIKTILKKMSVVRVDGDSADKIIGFDGKPTTPQVLSQSLNMSYRPGIVFFYQGKEVGRIGGMLRTFHTKMMLRFVAEQQFKNYERWLDFAKVEEEKILNSGQNIDIWQ